MTLLHLFKYEDEKQSFLSKKGEIIVPELYSVKAFEHANIKNNVLKIYYSKAAKATDEKVFNKYGMSVSSMDTGLSCVGPLTELNDNDYSTFIKLANEELKKYRDSETEYVAGLSANWIVSDFAPIKGTGLFGKKDSGKKKCQQYYDFLSLYIYNEILIR